MIKTLTIELLKTFTVACTIFALTRLAFIMVTQ